MSVVLIIGAGDMGERLAAGLATGGRVHRLVLAGRSGAAVAAVAATVASVSDCLVQPVEADGTRPGDIAALIARTRPDLIVPCASLRGPWALVGREDPAAQAVAAVGLGLRLPYQLPVILSVMRAVKDAGYTGPVANLSFPDVTGPVLRCLGLAPTVGLGNAGMILRRVRAALRAATAGTSAAGAATASAVAGSAAAASAVTGSAVTGGAVAGGAVGSAAMLRAAELSGAVTSSGTWATPVAGSAVAGGAVAGGATTGGAASGDPGADLPLVRILGQHSQVDAVMRAREPADPDERCRVYLGEDGHRADALAYRAPALTPGPRYNAVTAAAALPVLEALLPGAADLRWSAPAPGGRPGGYPILITGGAVTLDLPPGLTEPDAIAFNQARARADGIEKIDDDGTVHFTAATRAAVARLNPALAEPLPIAGLPARAAALDSALS